MLFLIFSAFFTIFAEAQSCNDSGKIYKICSDQQAHFQSELNLHKEKGQNLVVIFGADWCPWCISLHKIMGNKKRAALDIGLYQEREKVSSGFAVLELVKAMAGEKKKLEGLPLLALINPKNGKAIFIDTEPLEKNTKKSKGHDSKKIFAALHEAEKSLQ